MVTIKILGSGCANCKRRCGDREMINGAVPHGSSLAMRGPVALLQGESFLEVRFLDLDSSLRRITSRNLFSYSVCWANNKNS